MSSLSPALSSPMMYLGTWQLACSMYHTCTVVQLYQYYSWVHQFVTTGVPNWWEWWGVGSILVRTTFDPIYSWFYIDLHFRSELWFKAIALDEMHLTLPSWFLPLYLLVMLSCFNVTKLLCPIDVWRGVDRPHVHNFRPLLMLMLPWLAFQNRDVNLVIALD